MIDPPRERQFRRYPIQIPLLYRVLAPASIRPGVGWTRNLSEGGACVELAERLRPQMSVHVRLRAERRAIGLEARVVWAGEPGIEGGGVLHGVAFTRVTPGDRQAVRDLFPSEGRVAQTAVRLPLEVSVTYQRKGQAGSPHPGWTGNASRGGLLLRLPQVVPPGTVLELILHIATGQLTVEGAIVWVESPERQSPGEMIRHGLRFTSLGWSLSLSLGYLLASLP